MKKFFTTPIQELSVLGALVYVVLCSIIGFVSTILVLMLPQYVEKIWDWTESTFGEIKKKLCKRL